MERLCHLTARRPSRSWKAPGARRGAFTLIELLVVIAIIAILIALLVPAVQKVRESAARTQCQNNLKQVGIAVHAYVSAFKHVPSEGGAPAINGGPGNTSSVFFNVLPYLDQQPLYDCASGAGQNQPLTVFVCPSDSTAVGGIPPAGASTGALALGSYSYNVYVPGNLNGGVFPPYSTPALNLPISAAMPDGTSNTIIVAEHVQACGGAGGGAGGGPGGFNPWGTTANKRFFGSTNLAPRTLAVQVNTGLCTTPPNPPLGVAWFSTGHSTLNFLMGDGSVQSCAADVNVAAVLAPALTSSANDNFPGF